MKTTLITTIFALSLALVPALVATPAQVASSTSHTAQFAASCTKGCFANGEAHQAGSQFAVRVHATAVDQKFAASCTKGCFAEGETGELSAIA